MVAKESENFLEVEKQARYRKKTEINVNMTHQTTMNIKEEPCSPCPHAGGQNYVLTPASPSVYNILDISSQMKPQQQANFLQQVIQAASNGSAQTTVSWDTPIIKSEDVLASSDQAETKNRLKQSLLRKRKDLENCDDLFEEKKNYELTPAELERRERRKLQNRNAAKRCRFKKRKLQEEAMQETEKMSSENEELRQRIAFLNEEVQTLKNFIEAHQKSGLCLFPEHFQQLRVPVSVTMSTVASIQGQTTVSTDASSHSIPELIVSHDSSFQTCPNIPSDLTSSGILDSQSSFLLGSTQESLSSFASNTSDQIVTPGSISSVSCPGMQASLPSTSSLSSLPTECKRMSVEASIIMDNPIPQEPDVLPSWDLVNITPDYDFCNRTAAAGDQMIETYNAPEKASCIRNLTAEFEDVESKLIPKPTVFRNQNPTIVVFPVSSSGPDSPSLFTCVSPNMVQQISPPVTVRADTNNNKLLPGIQNFLTNSPSHLPLTPPHSSRSVPSLKDNIFNFDIVDPHGYEDVATGSDPVSPFYSTGYQSRGAI